MGKLSRALCKSKSVNIIGAEPGPYRIQILTEISPEYSVTQIIVFKRKSSSIIFDRRLDLLLDTHSLRHFIFLLLVYHVSCCLLFKAFCRICAVSSCKKNDDLHKYAVLLTGSRPR